jgi:hypothetical protein
MSFERLSRAAVSTMIRLRYADRLSRGSGRAVTNERGLQAEARSPEVTALQNYAYSTLRLRRQPTRLMPIAPSRIAPGAGT